MKFMRNALIMLLVLMAMAAVVVAGDLTTINAQDTTKTGLVGFGTKVNANITALEPQYSTNAISDTTAYTPGAKGQLLVDTATPAVWYSAGTTTNDWKKLDGSGSVVVGDLTLAAGKVIVGDAGGAGAAQTMSGDGTLDTNGVFAIAAGVVSNADVKANADISASKIDLTDGTGNITQDGKLNTHAPATLTVTNGQAVTVAASWYLVTSQGGADGTTNTITLADPGAAADGKIVTFMLDSSSTNLVGFADSGNLKLSGAANLDNYDVLRLYGIETNVWVEIGEIDN